MARIIKYTPPWLSRPSPGFALFASSSPPSLSSSVEDADGPSRIIAQRGTEVFVAVNDELRWSDLVYLRDEWPSGKQDGGNINVPDASGEKPETLYRVLKVPVSRKIKQLIVSPNEDYLAILTSHTVHVAVLPDPSHLSSTDTTALKLRTFQVGPTSHVVDRAALATALWHPLGVAGTCLVTITEDAIVRLWELNKDNRWSVDVPGLAIDLKKLGNGSNAPEDVTPSKYGTSKGFSPDSFEMEVSAACFGGVGHQSESSWASMTLWVAMREGDLYALCPLLPSRFRAPSTFPIRLSRALGLRSSSTHGDKGSRKAIRQQQIWLSELNPPTSSNIHGLYSNPKYEVYTRPSYPGAIPTLQGPFNLIPDTDDITDITDIAVISAWEEVYDLVEDVGQFKGSPLPIGIICLATSDGKVHVCLDVAGVEAAWLMPNASNSILVSDIDFHGELLHVETLAVADSNASSWPVFTWDLQSRYSFFVTHAEGVSHISLSSWVDKLATELESATDPGIGLRMDVLVDSTSTHVEHLIKLANNKSAQDIHGHSVPACIRIMDADLGYFVLVVAGEQPEAVVLDDTDYSFMLQTEAQDYVGEADIQELTAQEARPTYQKAPEFWYDSAITHFLQEQLQSHNRRGLTEEVRLSPANLGVIMEAHRILSHETHRLGVAAADLFRRCERMQAEFKDQIRRANEVASRVDAIVDDEEYVDEENEDAIGATAKLERRLEAVHSRQRELADRHDQLRQRVSKLSGRAVNDKERSWMEEIEKMRVTVCKDESDVVNDSQEENQTWPWQRFEAVQSLARELVAQTKESTGRSEAAETVQKFNASLDQRREKSARINAMLEREGALVEAAKEKLDKLRAMSINGDM